MEFKISEIDELQAVCKEVLAGTDKKVFLFEGDLGAGKTTFIKALCQVLGSDDIVSSPTFSLVNHYISNKAGDIFHFDFYRIKSPEEAMDIGFEEYLDSQSYCLIEWPEKIMKLIFTDYVKVSIKAEDNSRIIKVDY